MYKIVLSIIISLLLILLVREQNVNALTTSSPDGGYADRNNEVLINVNSNHKTQDGVEQYNHSLWEITQADGLTLLTFDDSFRNQIQLGKTVSLFIPQLNKTVSATLTSESISIGHNMVLTGKIMGGKPSERVIFVKNDNYLQVSIVTEQAQYRAFINRNKNQGLLELESLAQIPVQR